MKLLDPVSLKKINLNHYENFNGIPNLFVDDGNKINKVQSDFYNEVKFPNYNNLDDFGSLIEKTTKNFFLKKLDNEIGYNKKILEAGCGTGQLSIFLSRYKRSVYGIDLSIGSLLEAKKFIDKNNIKNVDLYRMNIFKMFFPKNYFDIVISNGVLHHTHNCRQAFSKCTEVLKKNGLIIVGLYHKYGRIVQKIRQFFFPILGENLKFFDRRFKENISDKKKYAWFLDQYNNPYETTHSYNELLKWFKEDNIEFLNCLPFHYDEKKPLFKKNEILKNPELFFSEILLSINYQQIYEGGFFIMIGKKK